MDRHEHGCTFICELHLNLFLLFILPFNLFFVSLVLLANCLSSQHGIQYEFDLEYTEYLAQKATGTLKQSHLRLLSEIFSEEQLDKIPIDNKVGENYIGELSEQLRKKVDLLFALLESA